MPRWLMQPPRCQPIRFNFQGSLFYFKFFKVHYCWKCWEALHRFITRKHLCRFENMHLLLINFSICRCDDFYIFSNIYPRSYVYPGIFFFIGNSLFAALWNLIVWVMFSCTCARTILWINFAHFHLHFIVGDFQR